MNKSVKTFTLSAISVALLSGCVLDDKYDDSSTGGGSGGSGAFGNIVKLYGDNSDSRFSLTVIDKDGNLTQVAESGDAESLNIRTTPVGEWGANGEGSVLVNIIGGQPAGIMTVADESQDITTPATDGTLQFFIRPLSKAQDGKKVFAKLPMSTGGMYSVDITSAFNSYVGAEAAQQVKLPLECFKNFDFTDVEAPFYIESESSLSFELGNTRIRANTVEEAHVVPCSPEGTLVSAPSVDVFERNRPESGSGWTHGDGIHWNNVIYWANNRNTNNNDIPPSRSFPQDINGGLGITFDGGSKKWGYNGGLRFNFGESYDFSEYMEAGVLTFDIDMIAEAINHSGTINFQFETSPGISSSMIYQVENLPVGTNEYTRITVPMKDFFTRGDGRVDVEALQHVVRLTIQPAPVKEGEYLNNMSFRINNIKMEMYPGK